MKAQATHICLFMSEYPAYHLGLPPITTAVFMYLTSRKEKRKYLGWGGGGIASLILLRIFTTVLSEKNELFSESGHVHQTSSILLCSDAQNNLCCSYYFCNTIKFGHKKLAIGFSSSKAFKELFI